MATMTTDAGPHNHWNCRRGCSAKPLTLADRELITGRSIVCSDPETGADFCGDCLADLPAGFAALFHVCGEEPVPAEPEPQPCPEAPAPAEQARARLPMARDVVWYHGDLTEYHGEWEVAFRYRGRLRLIRLERQGYRLLVNVPPGDVTIRGRVRRHPWHRAAKGA